MHMNSSLSIKISQHRRTFGKVVNTLELFININKATKADFQTRLE